MLHACRYFAKKSLVLIPGFGWGIWLMGNITISRNWTSDRSKIQDAFNTITSTKLPVWLVSYPEGTRITERKRRESQDHAKKRDLPQFKNVLLPRTKGFIATIKGLGNSHIKAVYDVTIVYRHKPTNTIQLAPNVVRLHLRPLSDEYDFHIDTKRFLISELPTSESELGEWLLKRFEEKERLLEKMKTSWISEMRLVQQ